MPSATRIGSCHGSTITEVPSLMWLVRPGQPREELQRIGAERVVGEVVLDRPDRVEAERLGQLGQPQLVRVHLLVGQAQRILEDDRATDVHREPLPTISPRR